MSFTTLFMVFCAYCAALYRFSADDPAVVRMIDRLVTMAGTGIALMTLGALSALRWVAQGPIEREMIAMGEAPGSELQKRLTADIDAVDTFLSQSIMVIAVFVMATMVIGHLNERRIRLKREAAAH